MSARFNLDKNDSKNLIKVLGYTIGTSVVVALIDLLTAFEFPTELLWVAPLVNTLLVMAKKFFEDKGKPKDQLESQPVQ